jgi:hypothetical protein
LKPLAWRSPEQQTGGRVSRQHVVVRALIRGLKNGAYPESAEARMHLARPGHKKRPGKKPRDQIIAAQFRHTDTARSSLLDVAEGNRGVSTSAFLFDCCRHVTAKYLGSVY